MSCVANCKVYRSDYMSCRLDLSPILRYTAVKMSCHPNWSPILRYTAVKMSCRPDWSVTVRSTAVNMSCRPDWSVTVRYTAVNMSCRPDWSVTVRYTAVNTPCSLIGCLICGGLTEGTSHLSSLYVHDVFPLRSVVPDLDGNTFPDLPNPKPLNIDPTVGGGGAA